MEPGGVPDPASEARVGIFSYTSVFPLSKEKLGPLGILTEKYFVKE